MIGKQLLFAVSLRNSHREYRLSLSSPALTLRASEHLADAAGGYRPSSAAASGRPESNNPTYIGRPEFGKQHYIKDPATGRRQARPNPRKDWLERDAPELRIISDELWAAVKERRRRINRLKPHDARRPKTLLSGKIDCGTCHAPMTKAGGWFRCTERLNSGACTNGVGLPIAYIERLILSAIQGLLLDPELEADFNREYHQAVAAHNQAAEWEAENSESRLRELDRRISKALDILLDNDSPSLRKRLAELEAEQEEICSARRIAAVIRLQPQSGRIYKAKVARLGESPGADQEAHQAREAIRACVSA